MLTAALTIEKPRSTCHGSLSSFKPCTTRAISSEIATIAEESGQGPRNAAKSTSRNTGRMAAIQLARGARCRREDESAPPTAVPARDNESVTQSRVLLRQRNDREAEVSGHAREVFEKLREPLRARA